MGPAKRRVAAKIAKSCSLNSQGWKELLHWCSHLGVPTQLCTLSLPLVKVLYSQQSVLGWFLIWDRDQMYLYHLLMLEITRGGDGSLVPCPRMPPGEKRSGEQS